MKTDWQRRGEQDALAGRPFHHFTDPGSPEAQAYLEGYKKVQAEQALALRSANGRAA